MIRTILKPLSIVPALLIMYMIFSFSSQPAAQSSQTSLQISVEIVRLADKVMHSDLTEAQIEQRAEQIHTLVRKTAHVSEYLLLAVFVALPLHVYGMHGFAMFLIACLISIGFAASDEYHQSFVSGRSMELFDVGIDSIGILLGLILARLFGWFKDKRDIVTRRELKREKQRSRNRRTRDARQNPVPHTLPGMPMQTGAGSGPQPAPPVMPMMQTGQIPPMQPGAPVPQGNTEQSDGTQPYRPYRYGRQVPPVLYRQAPPIQADHIDEMQEH